jgi:copper chaperone CopZ
MVGSVVNCARRPLVAFPRQDAIDNGRGAPTETGRSQARDTAEVKQLRRLDPRNAIEDDVVLADQGVHAEAEGANRAGDLLYMDGIELADLPRSGSQSARSTYSTSSGDRTSLCRARGAADGVGRHTLQEKKKDEGNESLPLCRSWARAVALTNRCSSSGGQDCSRRASRQLCDVPPIVKGVLTNVKGVSAVSVSQHADVVAEVTYDDAPTSPEALIKATTDQDYPAELSKKTGG